MSFRTLIDEYKSGYQRVADEAKVDFAVQLERAMEGAGVSRAELARKLGCNRSYVTKILRGDVNMTVETMAKVAHALNFNLDVHLTGKNVRWWKVIVGGSNTSAINPWAREWQKSRNEFRKAA